MVVNRNRIGILVRIIVEGITCANIIPFSTIVLLYHNTVYKHSSIFKHPSSLSTYSIITVTMSALPYCHKSALFSLKLQTDYYRLVLHFLWYYYNYGSYLILCFSCTFMYNNIMSTAWLFTNLQPSGSTLHVLINVDKCLGWG